MSQEIRALKVTAWCPRNCNGEEEKTTKIFEDWYHKGKLVYYAEEVAHDYFYDYFDKHLFKVTEIDQIGSKTYEPKSSKRSRK